MILLFLLAAAMLTFAATVVSPSAEAKPPSECYKYPDGTIECE